MKKQKKLGWRKLCESFSLKTPTTKIWSLIKLFKNRKFNVQKYIPDTSQEYNICNKAIEKLCPPSCLFNQGLELTTLQIADTTNDKICLELDNEISLNEINFAIKNTKVETAPGLDQISMEILLHLPDSYISYLTNIYNCLFKSGTIPTSLQKSLIVLLPKPDGKGVRSISLLSCPLKIFEKVIYNRLSWYVESNCILPEAQHGFRNLRSCADNLFCLTSFIHANFIKGRKVICAFIDIQGAFDNVILAILLDDLASIGVPAQTRKFIANITIERYAHFIVNGELTEPYKVHKDTPQGSILSPLLFST